MNTRLNKLIIVLICVSTLGACASSGTSSLFEKPPLKDYSNMYLRGNFSWFEANENFKLVAISNEEYAVVTELIADGQPYDFKVADAQWSMTLNCGNSFKSYPVKLDKSYELVCASDSLNLQFTPSETGRYQFILDVSDNDRPSLRIEKVE